MTEYSEATAPDGSRQPAGDREAASADAVLKMARELLAQDRSAEALAVIEQYAADTASPSPVESAQVFDAGVSDQELEFAFEAAESEREQMLDADAIAERAIRQTEPLSSGVDEIPPVEDDFLSSDSSYATRTVASLLESQGDAPTASRVRAIVDQSEQHPDRPSSRDDSKPLVRDRRTATIMELERWLVNLRGVTQ